MTEFSIYFITSGIDNNKLEEFWNLFDFTFLAHGGTYCKKSQGSKYPYVLIG